MNGTDRARPHRDMPWDMSALTATAAGTLIGFGLLLTAWVGASGEVLIDDQFAWLNFGLSGTVLAGASGALWIMQGRRAVGLRMRAVLAMERETREAATERQSGTRPPRNVFVAGPAMTRYHDPSCLLVGGKPVEARGPEPEHRRAGRRPCELCLPVGVAS
jgi:hypothetical protein